MALKTDPWLVLDGFMEALLSEPAIQALLERIRIEDLVDPEKGVTDDGRALLEGAAEFDVRWSSVVIHELGIAAWWWTMTAHAFVPGPRPGWTGPSPSSRQPERLQAKLLVPIGRPRVGEDKDELLRRVESSTGIPSIYDEDGAEARARETGRRWGAALYRHDVRDVAYAELARLRGWDPDARWRDVKRDVDRARQAMQTLPSPGVNAA